MAVYLGTTRRRLLGAAAATGAAAIAAPLVARHSLASSGELNFMGWAGYDFKETFAAFTKSTGIKVNFIEQPDQDAMVAQARAGGAGAYDVSEPTADRVLNWVEQEFIQPLDESKVNLPGVEPALASGAAGSMMTIKGQRYATPSVWGTEGITFNTEEVTLEYGKAGFADLWDKKWAGKLTVRPHSSLSTIGRWLDVEGKLPHPYIESFADQDKMVANYDVIIKKALELKGNVGQFWKDENSAQGAFRANGCVIGYCWDTSAQALQKEGMPVAFLAPKEGCTSWLQNFVIFKGAKNMEQAYAWISWMNTAEGSAHWATAFAANPSAKGAVDKMSADQQKFLAAAFPGDALEKLWWWPAQQSWFVAKRNEYADRFQAA